MKNIKTILTTLIILFSIVGKAQVGIGTIIPDAALDITSTTDGLLIPRVALTNSNSASPLTSPIISELVYNSATIADVTPGYYFWDGAKWVKLATGGSTDWSITGNTEIVDGNYIGTAALTNVDVAFRRNNLPAGKISATSTSFGQGALTAGATTNGTAFGNNALAVNTGTNNVAVGTSALAANTTGTNNVAVGTRALAVNTIGTQNTALGAFALSTNTAAQNTAVGFNALRSNTTGTTNSALGYLALQNTTGSNNTAIGASAGGSTTTGSNNILIGANTSTTGPTLGDQLNIGNTIYGSIGTTKKIGIGTTTPAGALDITSTTDGLLIPRVALTNTTTATVVTPTISELVYNTVPAGDVIPGFYYWNGTAWVSLSSGIETDPQVSSTTTNKIPKWNGTTLVDGNVTEVGANVGIGVAAPAGALDITSTTNGLLIPRVALTNTTTVTVDTGTASELVYNTSNSGDVTPGFYYLNTATGPWIRIATGSPTATGWLTTGNSGTDGTNYIGTSDAVDVAFRRNAAAAGKIGVSNTSFGLNAGTALTGLSNTAIGVNALAGLTSTASQQNTAVGHNALSANSGSTVTNCTAIGFQAGANVTSIDNTAVGNKALLGSGAGSEKSTAVGSGSMEQQTAGFNTAVGFRALFNGNGTGNVAVGNNSGEFHGVGSNCTMIGNQASAAGFNNATAIGYQAVAPGSNSVRIGNTGVGTINGQVTLTSTSDRRWKDNIKDSKLGLEFIKTIRPVSYFRKNDENKKTEYGFIAQELETAFVNVGDSNNAVVSKDTEGMYGVRYSDFISISVKAIQEQQELIEDLQKSNIELMKINATILERLEKLEKK